MKGSGNKAILVIAIASLAVSAAVLALTVTGYTPFKEREQPATTSVAADERVAAMAEGILDEVENAQAANELKTLMENPEMPMRADPEEEHAVTGAEAEENAGSVSGDADIEEADGETAEAADAKDETPETLPEEEPATELPEMQEENATAHGTKAPEKADEKEPEEIKEAEAKEEELPEMLPAQPVESADGEEGEEAEKETGEETEENSGEISEEDENAESASPAEKEQAAENEDMPEELNEEEPAGQENIPSGQENVSELPEQTEDAEELPADAYSQSVGTIEIVEDAVLPEPAEETLEAEEIPQETEKEPVSAGAQIREAISQENEKKTAAVEEETAPDEKEPEAAAEKTDEVPEEEPEADTENADITENGNDNDNIEETLAETESKTPEAALFYVNTATDGYAIFVSDPADSLPHYAPLELRGQGHYTPFTHDDMFLLFGGISVKQGELSENDDTAAPDENVPAEKTEEAIEEAVEETADNADAEETETQPQEKPAPEEEPANDASSERSLAERLSAMQTASAANPDLTWQEIEGLTITTVGNEPETEPEEEAPAEEEPAEEESKEENAAEEEAEPVPENAVPVPGITEEIRETGAEKAKPAEEAEKAPESEEAQAAEAEAEAPAEMPEETGEAPETESAPEPETENTAEPEAPTDESTIEIAARESGNTTKEKSFELSASAQELKDYLDILMDAAKGTYGNHDRNERLKEAGFDYDVRVMLQKGVNYIYNNGLAPAAYVLYVDSMTGNEIGYVLTKKGSTVTAPAVPEKDGLEFAGWYLDEELTVPAGADDVVYGPAIVYGKWTEAEEVIEEAEKTESESAEATEEELLPKTSEAFDNSEILMAEDFLKLVFDIARGLYGDKARDKKVAEKGYDYNTYLRAQHEVNEIYRKNIWPWAYALYADGMTGEVYGYNIFVAGKSPGAVAVPEKEGYTFTGWYLDAGYTVQVDINSSMNNSHILYAGWAENK